MKNLVFTKRRKFLASKIEDNSLVIIESAEEKIRNNDSTYRFRQNSNFYFLTGYALPNACLLLVKSKGRTSSYFFTKRPNKVDEIWTGKLESQRVLQKRLEMDECHYSDEKESLLFKHIKKSNVIYHSLDNNSVTKGLIESEIKNLEKKYRQGSQAPSKIISLNKIIHPMRLVKSIEEIKNIKKACAISVKAHKNLMQKCRPGIKEYELEAELIYEFKKNNCYEAYTSIVAGGKNACILHYINNDSTLQNGDLLLTDAAAEYSNYASDITRTIPINGTFTKAQSQIYELVLKAQLNAINKCKVNNLWSDIHTEAVKTLSIGLIKLGFIKNTLSKVLKTESYKNFYMHNTGHWLGLDVHDPLDYADIKGSTRLKAGMIFTVEPGLYIKPDKSIPKQFHNIGIRIEDDILVTKKGPVVLTSKAPKTISDIERQMKSYVKK